MIHSHNLLHICMHYACSSSSAKGEKIIFFIKGLTSCMPVFKHTKRRWRRTVKWTSEWRNHCKANCKENHSMGDVLDMMDMQVQNPWIAITSLFFRFLCKNLIHAHTGWKHIPSRSKCELNILIISYIVIPIQFSAFQLQYICRRVAFVNFWCSKNGLISVSSKSTRLSYMFTIILSYTIDLWFQF